jgi:hypothetical protein
MSELLFCFLLLIAGSFLAYRFSSASKVKKRMQEGLSLFEELNAESGRLRQSLQNEIELSSSQYIQGVNAARLKAIPLDELKKHATGMGVLFKPISDRLLWIESALFLPQGQRDDRLRWFVPELLLQIKNARLDR